MSFFWVVVWPSSSLLPDCRCGFEENLSPIAAICCFSGLPQMRWCAVIPPNPTWNVVSVQAGMLCVVVHSTTALLTIRISRRFYFACGRVLDCCVLSARSHFVHEKHTHMFLTGAHVKRLFANILDDQNSVHHNINAHDPVNFCLRELSFRRLWNGSYDIHFASSCNVAAITSIVGKRLLDEAKEPANHT